MKKRVLKKENLDEIGAKLLKAARMTDAEIETIVNKPQLFDSIAAKIKTEETARRKTNARERRSSLNFNLRILGAAVTATVLIVAAIVFDTRPDSFSEPQPAQNASITKPQTARLPGEKPSLPLAAETKRFAETAAQRAKAVRRNSGSTGRNASPQKPRARKSAPAPAVAPAEDVYAGEGVFYALPFADDAADDKITQIVRAELSRGELSALGIDLPLAADDDDEKILTDLIYGSNGEPRAFRLIGKL